MEQYQDRVGSDIQIPGIGRGRVKYVGPVHSKPGVFVGVDLLANIGKNDGSFQGTRYFSTEHPQSGLFIQLAKVEQLLQGRGEELPVHTTVSSRQSTVSPAPSLGRSMRMTNNIGDIPTLARHADDTVDSIEIDGFSSSVMVDEPLPTTRSSHGTLTPSANDTQLEELQQRVNKYEALLDEQRIVFEELQPVLDASERRTKVLEQERDELRRQLEQEHAEQQERRLYFDREHAELMEAVERLQKEIDLNEQRVHDQAVPAEVLNELSELQEFKRQVESAREQDVDQQNDNAVPQQLLDELSELQSYKSEMEAAKAQWAKEKEQLASSTNDSIPQSTLDELHELQSYKSEMESAKVKWTKEKEQLRMHNDSLGKEYAALNRELMQLSGAGDTSALTQQIDTLERQLGAARKEIREMRNASGTEKSSNASGTDKSTSASDQFCVLCEQPGHDQTHCPTQYAHSK